MRYFTIAEKFSKQKRKLTYPTPEIGQTKKTFQHKFSELQMGK